MSQTLCGETLTFAHDAQLLGFCLNDPNEPHGDDFVTRCVNKLRAPWVNPHEGFATPQDLIHADDADDGDDEDDGGESYEIATEVRGLYARYCAMSAREQSRCEWVVSEHLCALVGVSHASWTPPVELVLEAIEGDYHKATLREMALEAYLARDVVDSDIPMDLDHSDARDDGHHEDVRVPSARARSFFEEDEHNLRRGKEHAARRQTCGRRTRRETIRRNHEHYFGFAGGGDGFDAYVNGLLNHVNHAKLDPPEFLSVRGQCMMTLFQWFDDAPVTYDDLDFMNDEFCYHIHLSADDEFTAADVRDGMRYRDHRMIFDPVFDWFDDDDRYDWPIDDQPPELEDETDRLILEFGEGNDEVFDFYNELDRDRFLDTMCPSQSSQKRQSGKYPHLALAL